MSGSTRNASTGQRFMPTLRGLRYLDHRKNSPELAGTIVPWERVRLTSAHHALAAIILGDDGKPLGNRWRPVAWAVPYSQRRAVRWAAKRAEREMLAAGTFNIHEVDEARKPLVWLFRGALALSVLSLCVSAWMLWFTPNSTAAALTRNGVHAGVFLMSALNFGLMALLVMSRAGVNVVAVRVSGAGIEAELVDGRKELVRWDEIRRIHRGQMGPFVVESTSGLRLRLNVHRSAFVFRDWMERIGHAPTQEQQLRAILARSAIWCQLGALAGAWLISWLGGVGNQTPLGFYLGAGFLLPLFLVFASKYDDMIEQVARWKMRGRAGKRRAQSRSSSATSAAQ